MMRVRAEKGLPVGKKVPGKISNFSSVGEKSAREKVPGKKVPGKKVPREKSNFFPAGKK